MLLSGLTVRSSREAADISCPKHAGLPAHDYFVAVSGNAKALNISLAREGFRRTRERRQGGVHYGE